MQSDQPLPVPDSLSVKSDLSFADGFRFGCGFLAAFVIFSIALTIAISLIAGLAFLIAPGLANLIIH